MSKVVAMIHGTIGAKGGVSAKGFIASFADAVAKTEEGANVEVHIASNGGDIAQGNLIINEIHQSPKSVTTYNDSVAYSMAALIFLAGTERLMAKNSLLMIHAGSIDPGQSTSNELRDVAEMMDKYNHTLAETIATATGLSTDDVKAKWFDGKDHYFTADEAVEAKLATGIADYAAENMPKNIMAMSSVEVVAHFGFNSKDTADDEPTASSEIKNWTLFLTGNLINNLINVMSVCDDLEASSNEALAAFVKTLSVSTAASITTLAGLLEISEKDDVQAMAIKLRTRITAELKPNSNMVPKAELTKIQNDFTAISTDLATAKAELVIAAARVTELELLPAVKIHQSTIAEKEVKPSPFAGFQTAYPELLEQRKKVIAASEGKIIEQN